MSDNPTFETADTESWTQARLELLAREKELTRLQDEVNARRQALPRRRIEPSYVFDGADGPMSLRDLFGPCDQLLVYHFMFGPDWQEGCKSCSFWADHFDVMIPHLRARGIAFAAISRAPYPKLQAYAQRMGWSFRWLSSAANSFNRDFRVSFSEDEIASGDKLYNFGTLRAPASEMPGASAFQRRGDTVFHAYSTYTRGLDILNGTYRWIDMSPRGRNEAAFEYPMSWVRRHDEYERAD
ncbi:MAG: DUF899 domain-containing protein [Myxococcales bacterium FL481]|nr:MAG: DUF899 domain-containing protein [Myxococcales bacterium FL481]